MNLNITYSSLMNKLAAERAAAEDMIISMIKEAAGKAGKGSKLTRRHYQEMEERRKEDKLPLGQRPELEKKVRREGREEGERVSAYLHNLQNTGEVNMRQYLGLPETATDAEVEQAMNGLVAATGGAAAQKRLKFSQDKHDEALQTKAVGKEMQRRQEIEKRNNMPKGSLTGYGPGATPEYKEYADRVYKNLPPDEKPATRTENQNVAKKMVQKGQAAALGGGHKAVVKIHREKGRLQRPVKPEFKEKVVQQAAKANALAESAKAGVNSLPKPVETKPYVKSPDVKQNWALRHEKALLTGAALVPMVAASAYGGWKWQKARKARAAAEAAAAASSGASPTPPPPRDEEPAVNQNPAPEERGGGGFSFKNPYVAGGASALVGGAMADWVDRLLSSNPEKRSGLRRLLVGLTGAGLAGAAGYYGAQALS